MATSVRPRWRVDPADPRAPSQEDWDLMTEAERSQVEASLPSEFDLGLEPPEGDPHWTAIANARKTLETFFRKIGRKIYISGGLAVYYPGEEMCSPDLLAVVDVEPRPRTSWVVSREGKGLDWALEVLHAGDAAKDQRNIERYARLGIHEYFMFDRRRLRLSGFRLPPAEHGARSRAYRPIVPQGGRYTSEVLGLELMLEGEKLRFLIGGAALPEAEEMIAKLESLLGEAITRHEEDERRIEEEARRREALEAELAAMRDELERLKKGQT